MAPDDVELWPSTLQTSMADFAASGASSFVPEDLRIGDYDMYEALGESHGGHLSPSWC